MIKMIQTIFAIVLLFILASSCARNTEESRNTPLSVSEKINEAQQAIDANMERANIKEIDAPNHDPDGPYPADKFSVNKTGKFFIISLYATKTDSIWLHITAKSEQAITKKYPKLKAFKIRPDWISPSNWFQIRKTILDNKMVFDLNDEPKGWLLENESELK